MSEDHVRATISQRGVAFAESEVLIVRRTSDGEWELPGGRLEVGEDALAVLKRELQEETGLQPKVVTPIHTFAWQNTAGEHRFAVCYYCQVSEQAVDLSAEHDDYEWVSPTRAHAALGAEQSAAVGNAVEMRQSADAALEGTDPAFGRDGGLFQESISHE